jgi:hypothetical protein
MPARIHGSLARPSLGASIALAAACSAFACTSQQQQQAAQPSANVAVSTATGAPAAAAENTSATLVADTSSTGADSAAASPLVNWPKPSGDRPVSQTIKVAGTFDGEMGRFYGVGDLGTSSQNESQQPLFKLSEGATVQNVILGHPAADGIHCKGSCTLRNVWWENVGEDAATFRGQTASDVMLIDGGGASGARDKVFQSNRQGTVHIKNFYVEWFGKLFRSCGNCSQQAGRKVIIENVTAVVGENSKTLAGINVNYGDNAEFRGKNVVYDASGGKFAICLAYEGTSNNANEPKQLGPAADGPSCRNLNSNVEVRTEYKPNDSSVATKTP